MFLYLFVFVMVFFYNWLAVKDVQAIHANDAEATGGLSVMMYIMGSTTLLAVVKDPYSLFFGAIGAFVGAWVGVRFRRPSTSSPTTPPPA